jgi:hypothetical protein
MIFEIRALWTQDKATTCRIGYTVIEPRGAERI